MKDAFLSPLVPLLGNSTAAVQTNLGHIGPTAKIFFFVFIALSLGITYWAARPHPERVRFLRGGQQRHRRAKRVCAGGRFHERGQLPGHRGAGGQERLRRAALLDGLSRRLAAGVVSHRRVAARLGKYTFADVVAYRLNQKPVRVAAAVGTMAVDPVLPHRADGRRGETHPASVRDAV